MNSSSAGVTLNQGNVAVLSGPRDVNHYGEQNLLDFRIGYDQPIHESLHTNFYLDAFNMLNINTVDSQTLVSGSSYGHVTDFIAPRLFRLGAKISF